MSDITLDMMTASVREVQHNLASVLEMVSRGQEIAVTKRGRVIARIVPARDARQVVAWPDAAARMAIGYDADLDRERCTVSEGVVVVVPRSAKLE